jgi:hypothetical protein
MANDSISVSSKIKELVRLHRSGVLSDEEYHDLLKSQILFRLEAQPFTELNAMKESAMDMKDNNWSSSGKLRKAEYDLLKSEKNQDEIQPPKEKVEKVLWTLLN